MVLSLYSYIGMSFESLKVKSCNNVKDCEANPALSNVFSTIRSHVQSTSPLPSAIESPNEMDEEVFDQNEVDSIPEDHLKRDGKNKAWTVEEEKELLVGLQSAKTAGLRSENGFKPGCNNFLLTHMRSRFPKTDIQINPHIMSKLKVWKHDYGFLTSLLAKSGVGWDNDKKVVNCDLEIWRDHAKGYKGMRNKKDLSWPYYDDWCMIFGRDRATGEHKKDMNDAATKLFGEDVMKAKTTSIPVAQADTDDIVANRSETVQGGDFSYSNPAKRPCTKQPEAISKIFAGALDNMVAIARERMEDNKKPKVSSSQDTHKDMRGRLYAALEQCQNMTVNQILQVGRKLCKDPETLDFFWGLPEHAREPFAIQELEAMGIPFHDT